MTFSVLSVRHCDEAVETSVTLSHETTEDYSTYQPRQYVAYVYETNWYVANIF